MTTWTSERPTKDGNYWLSLKPEFREKRDTACVLFGVMEEVTLFTHEGGEQIVLLDEWDDSISDARGSLLLDGALWADRSIPADPFAQRTVINKAQQALRAQIDTPDGAMRILRLLARYSQTLSGDGDDEMWKTCRDLMDSGVSLEGRNIDGEDF